MAWPDPPLTWVAGQVVTAAQLIEQLRNALKAIGDPWTAFTPTWQATGTAPVLGNGTLTGARIDVGGLCIGRIRLTVGSTTTFGTGFYNFGLPFTLASGQQWESMGSCSVRDASAGASYGLGAFSASSTVISAATSAGARIGPTVPITLATDDIIAFDFAYEKA